MEHPTNRTYKPENLEHPRRGQVFRRGAKSQWIIRRQVEEDGAKCQPIMRRQVEEGGALEHHSVSPTIG